MVADDFAILTTDALARYLEILKSTISKLAHAGRIPDQKVARHLRLRSDVIGRWFEQGGNGATPKRQEER